MVVQIYISNLSGNKEIKKQQERVKSVISSMKIEHEIIDISSGDNEEKKLFMQTNSTKKDGQSKPLPPQIFNDTEYCGDYDAFDEANEDTLLMEFLKLAPPKVTSTASANINQGHESSQCTQEREQQEQNEAIICSEAPIIESRHTYVQSSRPEEQDNGHKEKELEGKFDEEESEGKSNEEEKNNNVDSHADDGKKKKKKKAKKSKDDKSDDSGSSSSSSESEDEKCEKDEQSGNENVDDDVRKEEETNEPPPLREKLSSKKDVRKSKEVHEYENVVLTPDGEKQRNLESHAEGKEDQELDVEFEPSDFIADECLQDLINVNAELQAAKAGANVQSKEDESA